LEPLRAEARADRLRLLGLRLPDHPLDDQAGGPGLRAKGGFGMDTELLAILAVAAAVALAISAAILLARSVEDKDVSRRVQGILRPELAREMESRHGISAAAAPFRSLGEALRNTTLVSEKDLEGFRMTIAAAGLNPRA